MAEEEEETVEDVAMEQEVVAAVVDGEEVLHWAATVASLVRSTSVAAMVLLSVATDALVMEMETELTSGAVVVGVGPAMEE